jgi:hypothetical protein
MSMLQNAFYAGWVVQPSQEEPTSRLDRAQHVPRIKGLHEPIISQEMYNRALEERSIRRGHREGPIGQPKAGRCYRIALTG